uniref:Uncharacterized protein n=1 Tax=Oryza glumipatula TaxID=40148 RepID=A0A0E0BJZ8_9ORYZ
MGKHAGAAAAAATIAGPVAAPRRRRTTWTSCRRGEAATTRSRRSPRSSRSTTASPPTSPTPSPPEPSSRSTHNTRLSEKKFIKLFHHSLHFRERAKRLRVNVLEESRVFITQRNRRPDGHCLGTTNHHSLQAFTKKLVEQNAGEQQGDGDDLDADRRGRAREDHPAGVPLPHR